MTHRQAKLEKLEAALRKLPWMPDSANIERLPDAAIPNVTMNLYAAACVQLDETNTGDHKKKLDNIYMHSRLLLTLLKSVDFSTSNSGRIE